MLSAGTSSKAGGEWVSLGTVLQGDRPPHRASHCAACPCSHQQLHSLSFPELPRLLRETDISAVSMHKGFRCKALWEEGEEKTLSLPKEKTRVLPYPLGKQWSSRQWGEMVDAFPDISSSQRRQETYGLNVSKSFRDVGLQMVLKEEETSFF